ncbi:hypothetical protein SDC9_96694 [bioreactor metagenome]|uniref:SON protein n=1 Tax=bioreactor metagenome TaxID=1076179 RepID=A0A645A9T7_9ZZZZ
MYAEAKNYLLEKIKETGLKTKPYTTRKALERSQDSHIGAVLFENENFARNGSKKLYSDQTGAQKKRRKVFDRTLAFVVIIGDYTDEAVEIRLESLLSSLDRGIMVAGNYVPIEVEAADWVDEDDSILKAKVAVQVKIRFDGGIYKDTDIGKLSNIEIESVEHRKEPTDGS